MAKIYETKEDFQRDVLKDQAADLRLKSSEQNATGLAYLSGSVLVDLWNRGRQSASAGLSIVSGALFIASIVNWVKSWRTSSRAHDLELERERLGPQAVVLPAEQASSLSAQQAHHDHECKTCKHRLGRLMKAQSHVEHAQRVDDANQLTR